MNTIPFKIEMPILARATVGVDGLLAAYIERLEDLRLVLAKAADMSFKAGYLNMSFDAGVATITDYSRANRLFYHLSLGDVARQVKQHKERHKADLLDRMSTRLNSSHT